jgi:hypothetical protein
MAAVIPISMPDELLDLIRAVAAETNLSQQDVIRQGLRLGIPKLRDVFDTSKVAEDTIVKLGPAPEIIWDQVPRT